MTMKVVGERLKLLRNQRSMSQAQLARKAKINPETVYRIETGQQPTVRSRTIEHLCKALSIEPGVLSGELPPPTEGRLAPTKSDSNYQLNVRLDGISRNAFSLVALQYGIPIARIVEIAPLLFTLVAELSLKQRRTHLTELESLLDRVEAQRPNFPHLPICITPTYEADEAVVDEMRSIEKKDILASDLPASLFARFNPIADDADESEYNPFMQYLRRVSAEWPSLADPQNFCREYSMNFVCMEMASQLACADKELLSALLTGLVQVHAIPRDLLVSGKETERLEWLRREHAAEKEKLDNDPIDLSGLDIESLLKREEPSL